MKTQLNNRYMLPRRPLRLVCISAPISVQQSLERIGYTPLSLIFRQTRKIKPSSQKSISYVLNSGQKIVIAPRLNLMLQWTKQIKSILQHRKSNFNLRKFDGESLLQQVSAIYKNKSVDLKNTHTTSNHTQLFYTSRLSTVDNILHGTDPKVFSVLKKIFINNKLIAVSNPLKTFESIKLSYLVNNPLAFKNKSKNSNNTFFKHYQDKCLPFTMGQTLRYSDEISDKKSVTRSTQKSNISPILQPELLKFKQNRNQQLFNTLEPLSGIENVKNASPIDLVYRNEQPIKQPELKPQEATTKPITDQIPNINVDRLANDVIKKINKKIQIERERRGLL